MEQLKKNYNALLTRFRKAEKWFDSKDRVKTDFTPKIEESFLKIIQDMSLILNELDRMGVEYTQKEVLEGFEN